MLDEAGLFEFVKKQPSETLNTHCKQTRYYLNIFKTRQNRFNWMAALFSPYWCIYRRQYSLGIIIYIIFFIDNVLLSIILLPAHSHPSLTYLLFYTSDFLISILILFSIDIILRCWIGFRANDWYFQQLDKRASSQKGTDITSTIIAYILPFAFGVTYVLCLGFISLRKHVNVESLKHFQSLEWMISFLGFIAVVGYLYFKRDSVSIKEAWHCLFKKSQYLSKK